LIYVWLNSPDLAVERVATRVRSGGHHIPEETIRRRYELGRSYFHDLYRPLADLWICLDNSGQNSVFVAQGERDNAPVIYDQTRWNLISEPRKECP
jgi:predicted ABC-type ATPase